MGSAAQPLGRRPGALEVGTTQRTDVEAHTLDYVHDRARPEAASDGEQRSYLGRWHISE